MIPETGKSRQSVGGELGNGGWQGRESPKPYHIAEEEQARVFRPAVITKSTTPSSTTNDLLTAKGTQARRPPAATTEGTGSSCHAHDGHAGDEPGGSRAGEPKVPLDAAVKHAEDPTWRGRVRSCFMKKFYAPGTLATKNAKRKRVGEIMEALEIEFPTGVNDIVDIASVARRRGAESW